MEMGLWAGAPNLLVRTFFRRDCTRMVQHGESYG